MVVEEDKPQLITVPQASNSNMAILNAERSQRIRIHFGANARVPTTPATATSTATRRDKLARCPVDAQPENAVLVSRHQQLLVCRLECQRAPAPMVQLAHEMQSLCWRKEVRAHHRRPPPANRNLPVH